MERTKLAGIMNVLVVIFIFAVCGISAYVMVRSRDVQKVKLLPSPAQNFNVGWYYLNENSKKVYIPTLPAHVPADSGGTARIYHTYVAHGREYLCFFTHHQDAAVYLNGEELYRYELEGTPSWLKSYRAFYHIVDLPLIQNSTVCLELRARISGREGEFNEVYVGDRAAILFRLIKNRADKLYLGLVLSIFGALVLLLGVSTIPVVTNDRHDFSLMYLGITGLALGVWQLEESRILQFFLGNQALHWSLEYMLQFVIVGSALMFIRTLTPPRLTGATNAFSLAILCAAAVQLALQLTGILQITGSAIMLYVMFIAICLYIAFLIVFTMKFSSRLLRFVFCVSMGASVVLFATAILLGSRRSKSSTDFWLTVGLTFMFFSLAVVVYQKTVEKFESMKTAKIYERMALVDFNTGVSSKTAWFYLVEKFDYTEHIGKIYCLIMFDMNNLKKLNDSLGHLVGDKVINAFCDCMRATFDGRGEIYRIGGDEFICLLEGYDEDEVKALLADFDRRVAEQEETELKFTVAYGWSMFKPRSREDFVAAQQRADVLMYDMKKRMKAESALAEAAAISPGPANAGDASAAGAML